MVNINYDVITIEDYEENCCYKGKETLLSNGNVIGFLDSMDQENTG